MSDTIAPAPDWYVRWAACRTLQGLPVALPYDPDAEPSNVHSIEAARTRRATEQMMRGRAPPERRL
jgi:transposase